MKILFKSLAVVTLMFVFMINTATAEVAKGDVIDKSSYQKIEGLVPDFIVTWVKDGEMTMKIGKLNFDAKEFWPKDVKDNWKANIGKYKIDKNNGIVDAKTGEPVRNIKGLPFPEPDEKDPQFPVMIMWNNIFEEYYLQGETHSMSYWLSLTRSGLEKTLVMENLTLRLNTSKSKQDYSQLSIFRKPFNMSGVGTLALYALYPLTNGIRFAWAPELRKVRRLSHRLSGSDVHFGFDGAPDDSWAGGPKTSFEEATYRFIEEKDALVPYYSENPQMVEYNENGEIEIGNNKTGFEIKYGFETPEWKGAPWHATGIVWVKSKVWVIESDSIVPNYGYGPSLGWVEKGTFKHVYKRMVDPNGELWKGFYWPVSAIETADGTYKNTSCDGQVVVDIRRDHGSAYPGSNRKGGFKKIMIKNQNGKMFTRAGFVKFSK